MSEWISVKDRLPDRDCTYCLVCHASGNMYGIKALWYQNDKIFTLYDPNYRPSLTLAVTHWLPLPPFPLFEPVKDE